MQPKAAYKVNLDLCQLIRDKVNTAHWPGLQNNTPELRRQLCQKYNIDQNENFQTRDIPEAIKKQILEILSIESEQIGRTYFNAIYNNLMQEHIVYKTDGLKSIAFAYYLYSMHGNEPTVRPLTPEIIDELIFCFQDLSKISDYYDFTKSRPQFANRQMAVANQISFLIQKYGFTVEILDGDIFVNDLDLRKASEDLENKIKAFGGINLTESLLNLLRQLGKYDEKQKRFHIIASGDVMGTKIYPTIPFGYLFQLSLKHPDGSGLPDDEQLQEILKISSAIVAALDVEPYSSWDTEFRSGHSALKMIQHLVQFDSNFKIPQIRSTDARKIIEGLFSWIADSKYEQGVSSSEVLEAAIRLCEFADKKKENPIVKKSDLTKILKKSRHNRAAVIDIFCHRTPPNQNFVTPTDWHLVDSGTKPLIQISKDEYWMPQHGWMLVAAIEAIRNYYRSFDSSFEGHLGDALEVYAKKEFTNRGISIWSGRYKERKGVEPEVDIAIESEKRIVFIEIKKKPLTKLALVGSSHHLLLDVYKSLLDSQVQTIRHEINLRKNGKIQFNDGSQLEHKNRETERLSLVLTEFGSLQDKTIIKQILPLFQNATFSTPDKETHPAMAEELEQLNKKCLALQGYYQELSKLIGAEENIPYFNCWFLSIPQLLVVFDHVQNQEDFTASLLSTKHMTAKSLDFYFEHSNAIRIKGSKL